MPATGFEYRGVPFPCTIAAASAPPVKCQEGWHQSGTKEQRVTTGVLFYAG